MNQNAIAGQQRGGHGGTHDESASVGRIHQLSNDAARLESTASRSAVKPSRKGSLRIDHATLAVVVGAYLCLVALSYAAGGAVMEALLPMTRWGLHAFAPSYAVAVDLAERNGQWLVMATFRTREPLLVGGQVIPADLAIDSSTLAGHGLQSLLIVFSAVLAASLRRGVARGTLWLSAAAGAALVQMVDTPLVLLGNVEGLLAQSLADPTWRPAVAWADFLESGGRLMLALVVAGLSLTWATRAGRAAARGLRAVPAVAVALGVMLLMADTAAQAAAPAIPAGAEHKISPQVWQALSEGAPVDALVLFRPGAAAATRRRLGAAAVDWLRDYGAFPIAFLRVRNRAAAEQLLALDDVQALMPNLVYRTELTESLPLVEQPIAASLGYQGGGQSVAVIDTGVDYTRSAFGSCSAPGVPMTCRVVYAADVAPDDGMRDAQGHGTHVAGIVAGVAPAASLVALDVFDSNGTTSAALLTQAIDWVVTNRALYNISAINLSLSDGVNYTSPCNSPLSNPLKVPLDAAATAGVVVVAASGNNGYKNGISNPACTPSVISVGAVYDANLGARNWGTCSDATTAADKVTCFSNSANFLTLLAPGSLITAAGISNSGTSMAAPHVAGAVAVLRGAFPGAGIADIHSKLVTSDVAPVDAGNGLSKPRLDLRLALGALAEPPPPTAFDEDVPFLPAWAWAVLAAGLPWIRCRKKT